MQDAFVEYEPPALYDAVLAELEVDQPRNEYPLRVGFVEESVNVTPCVFV